MSLPIGARARRWLLGAALAVLAVLLAVWGLLPGWVRTTAQEQLGAALGRPVSIEAVRINPLTLTVEVDQLQVAGANPQAPPVFAFDHLKVSADLRSIWRWAPVVDSAELHGPRLRVARLGEGHYDIDDLLARLRPAPDTPADTPPPRFALYNLSVRDGQISFDDRPVARVHEVRAVQVGLPFLSNLDEAVDIKVEPRLAFELNGTPFDTGTSATPFAAERAGELNLKTGRVDLAHWLPYLPAGLPARPLTGQVWAELKVQFSAPAGGTPRVVLSGRTGADSIKLVDASGGSLLDWERLVVPLVDVQPLQHQLALGEVDLQSPRVWARRDARGALNWIQALGGGGPVAGPTAAAAAATGPAWRVSATRLTVQGGHVQWRDEAVRPAAQIEARDLRVQIDAGRWPLPEAAQPVRLSASANWGAPTGASAASAPGWQVGGELSAAGGQARLQAQGWPLAMAAPYLSPWLKPRIDGQLGFDAKASWAGTPGGILPRLSVAALTLDDLRVAEPGPATRGASMAWRQLSLASLDVDPVERRAVIGPLRLDQPRIAARRDAGGGIDLAQWLTLPNRPDSPAAPRADEPVWRLQLQDASVEGGQLRWRDEAVAGGEPVALELSRLRIGLRDLQWPAVPRARAKLQGQVQIGSAGAEKPGAAGQLSWQGELGLLPLSWRGTVRADRFPVHAVAAYAGEALPVTVTRAEAGWAGDVAVQLGADGVPGVTLKGDARLTDLRLHARQATERTPGDELVSWQALELKGVQVTTAAGQKPRVEVADSRLSDFYAKLMVDEGGRFNLTDLNPPAGAASAAEVAAPAASAVAATGGSAIDLIVGGVQLQNGRVDFSDRFIRPNYNAALSDLNGRLGAFRTGTRDMAALELRGRVAGTALLDIRGALNPTADPLALDIQARATDLELAPLSPYAGKYAGYAIERGKLSMDVSYRIDADGKLDAKNQIVLNQLTFGDRIESPEATKLPVLLAVALLKDRNGVIDLDLPIGGSINDPQFSVGGLIVKVILNLLGKVLTAPFALLSGGGSEDLSLVEFGPGTAQMEASADPVIDKVAKALADRPALQMTVTGAADPQSERDAVQTAWLEQRLTAERRRDAIRAGAATDAPLSPLGGDERARLIRRLYADTKLLNKPTNLVGLAKDIPVAEMEALLKASHLVNADTARELALQRGLAVRDALIAKGLPSERLFLAAPKLRAAGENDALWTPRVQLSLGTK